MVTGAYPHAVETNDVFEESMGGGPMCPALPVVAAGDERTG
jgi:hypothetical protein